MRSVLVFLALSLATGSPLLAQSEGYRLLFPADSVTIAETDQRAIFDQLGYVVSADGTSLEVVDCGTIFTQVAEEDLNGDGTPEVFVLGGNTCTSGGDGSNLTVLTTEEADIGQVGYEMALLVDRVGRTVEAQARVGTGS